MALQSDLFLVCVGKTSMCRCCLALVQTNIKNPMDDDVDTLMVEHKDNREREKTSTMPMANMDTGYRAYDGLLLMTWHASQAP